jgi:arsenate reductase (glutaredoxin)
MAMHPDLLQRPIVERRGRAVLARPPERVLELLD